VPAVYSCAPAVTGVTELLAELAGLVPAIFVAVTVNVYVVPPINPSTVIGDDAPVPVSPPVLDVTLYAVIAAPPSFAGAVNVMDA
jgi:hypothetical protein